MFLVECTVCAAEAALEKKKIKHIERDWGVELEVALRSFIGQGCREGTKQGRLDYMLGYPHK